MPIQNHIVPKQRKTIRLQEYAIGIFTGIVTKSALKKAIKKHLVFVDGKLASTATPIKGSETITLHEDTKAKTGRVFQKKLEVLFEDEYLAAIHKPAGLLVSGNSFKTVGNALEQNIAHSLMTDATKPRPVHRLDYPTTGVLLVGKTRSGILELNRLFEKKEIDKTYYAVAIGEMKKEGFINVPIDGKEALSHFKIIKSVLSDRFGLLNLVKLSPKTGRRHQLRKHMAHIGNPILGDADYGKAGLILKGKGLYLHAFSVEFTHPFSKENVKIKKELPIKFKKIFNTI
ncbi:RluA family pseudouridine synthase [Costertonia aggregata]|uniref:RluA family pseudouridine synthase n=1 Tax=Costertonia aggregata TaxID=343403 RepID=A0A7H9AV34_9FLAO|nr:RluA family pseudouridine synthase [Costertonia aggregata]